MKLNVYVVDLELSPRQKKVLRGAVVAAASIAVLGVGIALAAPIDTTWVANGQPLSASSLKGDLDGLQSQINKPVVTKNGKQYSIGATYCGKTANTTGQVANGYAGVKALCETVAACGSSPSAHMCSAEEMLRSRQLGIVIDLGWVSTGAFSVAGNEFTDCQGWTSNLGSENALKYGYVAYPAFDTCNNSYPILCCD